MKFKAILFDCDGLMFDTEILWKYYFFEANKVFNQNFTEHDRVSLIGKNEKTIREALKQSSFNLDVDAYRDWIHAQVKKHIDNHGVDVKRGLVDLINFCILNRIKMGIVSGSKKTQVQKLLKSNNIAESYFDVFATGELDIKPTPNPDLYLYSCQELGLTPNDCIVLEDSYLGVEAGHKAGCFTIMIPDLLPVNSEMEQMANLIFPDLLHVIDFLNENNK